MIEFNSFNRREIRKKSEYAYMVCAILAMDGDLLAFCQAVEDFAAIEWHPSLVIVRFDEVTVNLDRNEIDGTINEIFVGC